MYLLLSLADCTSVDGQNRSQNIGRLFELLELKEGSWVADIGSREGYFTTRMAPIVGETGHVFAVDINDGALKDLHASLQEQNIQNVTPVYSTMSNPMLPANTFDAVLIRNTYHEFNKPVSMLKYIKQALKPGGRLVIVEPIDPALENADRQLQARNHDISLAYVKEDLSETGFKITEEIKHFSDGGGSDRFWLLVAQPAL